MKDTEEASDLGETTLCFDKRIKVKVCLLISEIVQ